MGHFSGRRRPAPAHHRKGDLRDALWEAILRSARDAIISIDRRGRIILFNPAAEEMFGYSADEVLGCEVGILMPPPFRDEHQDYIRRYEQGGPPRAIGRIRQVVGAAATAANFPSS